MRKTKEAFKWIINILKKHKIPYRISGGLAARIYGSKRPLRDIDIEIQDSDFKDIIPDIKKYIKEGPKNFKDKVMKTYGLVLFYKGQQIEFSGTETEELFDAKRRKWIKSKIDISKITKKKVYGGIVKVIRKKDLLVYKKMIGSRKEDFD